MTRIHSNSSSPSTPLKGVLFLAGPNGCGKGTLAETLLRHGDVSAHVSMGQLLRDLVQEAHQQPLRQQEIHELLGSDTALQTIDHSLKHGLLIDNHWTETLIEMALQTRQDLHGSRWILDGYPRKLGAAQHLLGLLKELGIPVVRVIHLTLSEHEVLQRSLARGRPDDTPEAIQRRYDLYQQEVLPTLQYLREHLGDENVLEVSAHQAQEPAESKRKVYQQVKALLTAGQASHGRNTKDNI